MEIKQLRSFVAIVENGSVTRAADVLRSAQPAISRHLKLLEQELGVALFERTAQGMTMNAAAQILLGRARRILHDVDKAREEIRPFKGPVAGTVTIGLLRSTSELLSRAIFGALKQKYPKIQLRMSVGFSPDLQQWVDNGEADAAMIYAPLPSPTLRIVPMLQEPLYLVGLPGSGLQPSQPVALSDLDGMPLYIPGASYGLRRLIDAGCMQANVTLKIHAETNGVGVQKNLVEHGLGFTILPSSSICEELARGALCAAPLTKPDLHRTIFLVTPAKPASLAGRCVVHELIACIKESVDSGRWPDARWLLADHDQGVDFESYR